MFQFLAETKLKSTLNPKRNGENILYCWIPKVDKNFQQ